MFKQKPFPFSVFVLLVLIALHLVGSYFSLYWVYPWFDSVVHVVSGLWVALMVLWLASMLGQINSLIEYRTKTLLIAFISAGLIGVVWEIFENVGQLSSISSSGYSLDTALDILSDIIGGVLAYLYFIQKRKHVEKQSEVLYPFSKPVSTPVLTSIPTEIIKE